MTHITISFSDCSNVKPNFVNMRYPMFFKASYFSIIYKFVSTLNSLCRIERFIVVNDCKFLQMRVVTIDVV